MVSSPIALAVRRLPDEARRSFRTLDYWRDRPREWKRIACIVVASSLTSRHVGRLVQLAARIKLLDMLQLQQV